MEGKKKFNVKNIILLQAVVVIYTINSIIAKFATGADVFSLKFFLFYGAEVAVLGIYAICWQQMIKKFDLSIAYANRAMAILWTAIWALLIFRESISAKQAIGIVLVIIGTIVVNWQTNQENETDLVTEKGGEAND